MQRHLLAIFAATIVALVAQPLPMGASVVVSMTLLALTRTLPPAKVLSGFSNITVWLIFLAFLFGRAFTVTGLGKRIGYLFVRRFARSPLSLGYSLAAADLVLAPFIPSDTARGGSVIFPVTRSVAAALGSEPGPTANRAGKYLILTSFHTCYAASAMFLTSMAANPLIAEFAMRVGHVELTWMRWFAGSSVPGLLTLAVVPWLLCRIVKPELQDMHPARDHARVELDKMGPLRREEKWLIAIMLAVMAGWVTSNWHGVSNTFVAFSGLAAILLTGVLSWDDLLAERRAWDALIWFAPLLMMSDALNQTGVIKILSARLFGLMSGWPWMLVLLTLAISYFYSALHFRQPDRADHRVICELPGRCSRGRCSAPARRAAAGLPLELKRRHYALRHRIRAHFFQRRVSASIGVVAHRLPDIAGRSGDLARRGHRLVETHRILVVNAFAPPHVNFLWDML